MSLADKKEDSPSHPPRWRNMVAEEHRRAQQDVRRKMARVYGLDEAQLTPSAAVTEAIRYVLDHPIQRLDLRLISVLHWLPPDQGEKAEPLALQCIQHYMEAFFLRSAVFKIPIPKHGNELTRQERKFYSHERGSLIDLYINHLTNVIQSGLTEACHGDREAAYNLHKYIITTAIATASRLPELKDYTEIYPQPSYPWSLHVDAIENFTKKNTKSFGERYRSECMHKQSFADWFSETITTRSR